METDTLASAAAGSPFMETERLNIKGQEIHQGNRPLHVFFSDLESVTAIPVAQNDEGIIPKYRGTGIHLTVVIYGVVPYIKILFLS